MSLSYRLKLLQQLAEVEAEYDRKLGLTEPGHTAKNEEPASTLQPASLPQDHLWMDHDNKPDVSLTLSAKDTGSIIHSHSMDYPDAAKDDVSSTGIGFTRDEQKPAINASKVVAKVDEVTINSKTPGEGHDNHTDINKPNRKEGMDLDAMNYTSTEVRDHSDGLAQGELAPNGMAFVPITALAKFPYKLLPKDRMEEVAKVFFNGGRFWERDFHLYYVWSITRWAPVCLIVIPFAQFHELILQINCACDGLDLESNDGFYGKIGFVMTFDTEYHQLRPRYLGRSRSRDDYNRLTGAQLPTAQFVCPGETPDPSPTDDAIRDFNKIIETAANLKNSKKIRVNDSASLQETHKGRPAVLKQLRRAQFYLGLRANSEVYSEPSASTLVVDKSVNFPPWEDVVLICVDVEAYERNHNLITEVGITTLDTRDLLGTRAGKHGEERAKQMRCRHFRVLEHIHLRNSEFVSGCPDNFEFGESEVVTLADLPHKVASCFKTPFSRVSQAAAADEHIEATHEKRNIVLVGHNASADIRYLQRLGYDPFNLPNLRETLDTAQLWRVMSHSKDTTSLGNLLYQFDIIGWHLHNAGNDAAYTMQALIALIIRSSSDESLLKD